MSEESLSPDHASSGESFFSVAFERIVQILAVLLPCSTILLWIFFNHRFAVGFIVGGVIAIIGMSLMLVVLSVQHTHTLYKLERLPKR